MFSTYLNDIEIGCLDHYTLIVESASTTLRFYTEILKFTLITESKIVKFELNDLDKQALTTISTLYIAPNDIKREPSLYASWRVIFKTRGTRMTNSTKSPRIGILSDLPITCKLLLGLSFIEAIGGGISYHIAYFFSLSTNFNKLHIGFLGFAMGIGSILGSIYGGYFTEKVRANNLIGTSFLLIGISFICLAKTHNLHISTISMLLMGFGINLFITCSNSSLLQISGDINHSLTIAQSYKNALENAGCIVATILIMILAQDYFKSVMLVIGIFFILFSIYIFLKLEIHHDNAKSILNETESINTIYSALVPMLFAVFCIGLTYGIQKTVLGVHLNETIGNSFVIGFFFATDPILIVLFQIRLSRGVERFNRHTVACIGCPILRV